MSSLNPLLDSNFLMEAIQKEVAKRVQEIAEEESAKAAEKVKDRIKGVLPQVVMKLMTHYEAHSNERFVTIRVRKDL